MKRPAILIIALAVALVASTAAAQTHDHFARQRQEAITRQAAAQQQFRHRQGGAQHGASYHGASHHGVSGHWGGPTTNHRFYHPTHGHGSRHGVQFYSVNPFGNPYGYGVPGYGFYGSRSPYFGTPFGGSGIYIHREIYLGR